MTRPAKRHAARSMPQSSDRERGQPYVPERKATEEEVNDALREALAKIDHWKEHGEYPPEPPPPSPTAVLDARPRLTIRGWTPARQRAFIEHLAAHGSVTHAAVHVGMTRQAAYQLRRRGGDSIFALLWDIAITLSRQAMLDEATERAMKGHETPVWYRGEQVGTRIAHNDRLLMFLLARDAPPPHPYLRLDQLLHLWPMMMAEIDGVMPAPDDAAEFAALADRWRSGAG